MNPGLQPNHDRPGRAERASVLIIVLWVALGLVGITLYFASSMTQELRASDNRASGLVADQAIEGAARYVDWALSNYATNGAIPTNRLFVCEDIPIGDARVWMIGRDAARLATTTASTTDGPVFGLVDEASKLNINMAPTNALAWLPGMSSAIAEAIVDWRSTNAVMSFNYGSVGYEAKHGPFETVEELRLVYGMTTRVLLGDDANHNGILDTNEKSLTGDRSSNPGMLEFTTVYSREPNFHANGSTLTNINTRTELEGLLKAKLSSGRSDEILRKLGFTARVSPSFTNLLSFYVKSGLTTDDFAKIYGDIAATTNAFVYGRVNINTAPEPVLKALFIAADVDESTATSAAQSLINYRKLNPSQISTVAWMATALGTSDKVVAAMVLRDWITTRSYQFTADIAAVGPNGRGYRRVKFVFDVAEGYPKIIYRQDLGRLGWALGPRVRETLLAKNFQ
jgi:DNA uptake protein ComE-like DNA-binding protein